MIFQTLLISSIVLAIKSDAIFDPCSSNPCQNGATCISEDLTKYRCLCPLDYYGDNCQKKKISLLSEEDNSSETERFNNKQCLNGGKLIKHGLPCSCPDGYTGSRCEVFSSKNYCTVNTCLNDGICHQYGLTFKCQCQNYYYGPRCEFRSYGYRRTTGISSFSSLLMIIGLIALIAYCFCFKQKRNDTGPFMPGNNGFSGVILRPGNISCPYPQTPFYSQNNSQNLANSNLNYPNYVNTPNRLPQTSMPDPEEAFRVNQAPPSYEEVQNMKKPNV